MKNVHPTHGFHVRCKAPSGQGLGGFFLLETLWENRIPTTSVAAFRLTIGVSNQHLHCHHANAECMDGFRKAGRRNLRAGPARSGYVAERRHHPLSMAAANRAEPIVRPSGMKPVPCDRRTASQPALHPRFQESRMGRHGCPWCLPWRNFSCRAQRFGIRGGDLIVASLLNHWEERDSKVPSRYFRILDAYHGLFEDPVVNAGAFEATS